MRNKNQMLWAAYLGMLIFGICLLSLGSVLPFLDKEYQLSELDKGSIASILPVGILIGSLVFGPIVDRYSYKFILIFSILLIASAFEIIAHSNTFFLIKVSFLFIGLGGGFLNGATSALVADISSEFKENKSANLSLLGVFFGIGALGIPMIMGVIPESVSYRKVLMFTGIIIILPVIYLFMVAYPPSKQKKMAPFRIVKSLLKEYFLISIAFVLFFQSALEGMVNNWTATYFHEYEGLDTKSAMFCLTLFVLSFTIARLVLKFILNLFPPAKVVSVSILLALLSGLILVLASSPGWFYLAVILMGFGLASGFPVFLGIIGDQYKDWSGTAFSIVFTIALLGNITLNFVIGLITERKGLGAYPYVYVASILLFSILFINVLLRLKSKTN
jgi:MFS family permease